MTMRRPREILRETHGDLEAVIYGCGHGHFGRMRPALRVTRSTGPGLMDWEVVAFSRAETVRTLRNRWTRIKRQIRKPE